MPRLPGLVSSAFSTTGCAPIFTAARSSPSSNPGGSASQGRFSTIPDGVLCLRLCERSLTSSEPRVSQLPRGHQSASARHEDVEAHHRLSAGSLAYKRAECTERRLCPRRPRMPVVEADGVVKRVVRREDRARRETDAPDEG